MTLFEVATRMELGRDGKHWHVIKDGTVVGLPSSKSKELAGILAPGGKKSGPSILKCGVAKRFNWSWFAAIVVSSTELYSHLNTRPSFLGFISELSSWI